MSEHHFYDKIMQALKEGTLSEPFCCDDVEQSCVGTEGFSQSYLEEHAVGNEKGNPELFIEEESGRYRCVRPSDYSPI
jgi:hypothetical protein